MCSISNLQYWLFALPMNMPSVVNYSSCTILRSQWTPDIGNWNGYWQEVGLKYSLQINLLTDLCTRSICRIRTLYKQSNVNWLFFFKTRRIGTFKYLPVSLFEIKSSSTEHPNCICPNWTEGNNVFLTTSVELSFVTTLNGWSLW